MGKIFTIGDIHGNARALIQCLERSNFNYDEDTLIQLGDVVDGYSDVSKCVDILCDVRYLISIRGNHDAWFKYWLESGIHPDAWKQGGVGTAKSYLRLIGKEEMIDFQYGRVSWGSQPGGYIVALNPGDVSTLHHEFFNHQVKYYIDEENRLFIHGGFNRHKPIKDQEEYIFAWDRDLWMSALSFREMPVKEHENTGNKYKFKIKDDFKEVFIGHTATTNWNTTEPMTAANIWNLDTGAGTREGKLTIMDVDTKEYWQSDLGKDLYPDEQGRK